jgi:type 1 glutamine amidotransferase
MRPVNRGCDRLQVTPFGLCQAGRSLWVEKRRMRHALFGLRLTVGWFSLIGLLIAVQSAYAQSAPRQVTEQIGRKTKIVFIAGTPSHHYAEHEHHAGCVLLAECLRRGLPNVDAVVCKDGWPQDPKVLDGVNAIVVYADGGKGNPMLPHLDQIDKLMKEGVGLACLHYAVVIPKGRSGDLLSNWIGGYYEEYWSVNPFWTADFKQLPDHPVARGVKSFAIEDEWYYNMRFTDEMQGVTPILSAVPPDSTRERPDGPHSGNPTVRSQKGRAEHVAWARVRPDGGRGFCITGCHSHWSWANDNFRTVVLNGIAWVAKLDIPPRGVSSKTPTIEELQRNLDKPQPAKFDQDKVRKMIERWNR